MGKSLRCGGPQRPIIVATLTTPSCNADKPYKLRRCLSISTTFQVERLIGRGPRSRVRRIHTICLLFTIYRGHLERLVDEILRIAHILHPVVHHACHPLHTHPPLTNASCVSVTRPTPACACVFPYACLHARFFGWARERMCGCAHMLNGCTFLHERMRGCARMCMAVHGRMRAGRYGACSSRTYRAG